MKKKVPLQAAVPSKIKENAELILSKLGLTPSAAIELFYRQIIHERALPFKVALTQEEELRPVNLSKLSVSELDHELNLGLASLKKEPTFSLQEAAHLLDMKQKKQQSRSKVYYSSAALTDLKNIEAYLDSYFDGQGANVIGRLQAAARGLGSKSFKHQLLNLEPWHSLGIYQANRGQFTFFYQITPQQKHIEVLRLMANVNDLSELENE